MFKLAIKTNNIAILQSIDQAVFLLMRKSVSPFVQFQVYCIIKCHNIRNCLTIFFAKTRGRGVPKQHCRPYDYTNLKHGYEMINQCVLWEENEIILNFGKLCMYIHYEIKPIVVNVASNKTTCTCRTLKFINAVV